MELYSKEDCEFDRFVFSATPLVVIMFVVMDVLLVGFFVYALLNP